MAEIILPYQWRPRPFQQAAWDYLSRGGMRAVLRWPRRHGKDDLSWRHLSCAMAERKGNYWYLLPEYAQARKAMWDAVDETTGQRRIDMIMPPELRDDFREQEMLFGFQGSTAQLVGADNYHSLVGSPPVGLVFSEYARTNPSAWAYLMPIVERNGGWVIFNSTPYGDNHYKRLYEDAERRMQAGKDWFVEHLTAEDCGVYTAAQLEEIKSQLQSTHGEDYGAALFLQEYYCSFDAAIPGSIWGDCLTRAEATGRILDFPFDPALPVHTGWDLGRTDATAIWFYQMQGRNLDVLDYHESTLKDIPFYVELLQAWAKNHGTTYGTHFLPHDARPRTQAAGGKSILAQFMDAKRGDPALGTFSIVKKLDRIEGIQAARATFPLCRFHQSRCKPGIDALKHYHYEWDEELRRFTTEPVHDWASHGADAFRELSLSWRTVAPPSPTLSLGDGLLKGNPVAQTISSIRERHFRRTRESLVWGGR